MIILEAFRSLASTLQHHKYSIAAFLVPLFVRSIPEVIAGPYPIGYDSIASYVPIMHYWVSGDLGPFNPAMGGWVLFALLGIAYQTTRLDPIVIVKATGPLLYGILGGAIFACSRTTLAWGQRKSLFMTLFAATYFVTLRVGWDLFRNTLALSFLLFALSLGSDIRGRKKSITFMALGWLVVATHPLVGALFLGIVGFDLTRRLGSARKLTLLAIPAALQFAASLAWTEFQGTSIITLNTNLPAASTLAYPLYVFLPLGFLVPFGLSCFRGSKLLDWVAICGIGIILMVSPLSPSMLLVQPERWTWMMSIPLVAIAIEGYSGLVSRLRSVKLRVVVKFSTAAMMLFLSAAFIFAPATLAFPYFDHLAPSSMLQSTIPVEESPQLSRALIWASTNIAKDGVLVLHNAIYGWATEYFKAPNPVIWSYPGTSLSDGLSQALKSGYSVIYTIWWANGEGWYGEPWVPSGFILIHREGAFGVFLFAANTGVTK